MWLSGSLPTCRETKGNTYIEKMKIEKKLRHLCYNPKTGFQSVDKLYNKAIEQGLAVKKSQVRQWLKSQSTFTRFRGVKGKHTFRKTMVDFLRLRFKWILLI